MNLNLQQTKEKLVKFLKTNFENEGFKKGIIGLSGGIDSAIVAYLAVEALGNENILGILLPYKTSSKESIEDAKLIAEKLKIKTETIEITDMVDKYCDKYSDMDKLRKGNKMARERMSILYDIAKRENALVIGTSNKTETLLGYGTQYGDTAWAINPIGCLYKTQVWELSKFIGIPERVINKNPSADLWEGQTDEDELGFTYRDADNILYMLNDKKLSITEVEKKGYNKKLIEDILLKIKTSEFKRRPPLVASL